MLKDKLVFGERSSLVAEEIVNMGQLFDHIHVAHLAVLDALCFEIRDDHLGVEDDEAGVQKLLQL